MTEIHGDVKITVQCEYAEEQLLGYLLGWGEDFHLTQTERLAAVMFWKIRHSWIFEAMYRLYTRGDGIDLVTVSEELQQQGRLAEVNGNDVYLSKLTVFTMPANEVRTHAAMIRRASERRTMLKAASGIAKLAHDESQSVITSWSLAQREIADARPYEPNQNFTFGADSIEVHGKLVDDMRESKAMFPVPWKELDRAVGHLQPGDMCGVVGPTGGGKSSLLYTLAEYYAIQKIRTVYIFTEMRLKKVLDRRLAKQSGIDYRRLKNPVEFTDGEMDMQRKSEGAMLTWMHRLNYWHAPLPDTDSLLATTRRMREELGTVVFIIDHMNDVQLMDDHPRAWSSFLTQLEVFGNETGSLIWTAAQKNRNDGKAYMIGQAFDQKMALVMELQPDELKTDLTYTYDGRDYTYRAGQFNPVVPVKVRKNRDGGPARFDLLFVGPRFLWVDVPPGFDDGSDDPGAHGDVYRGGD